MGARPAQKNKHHFCFFNEEGGETELELTCRRERKLELDVSSARWWEVKLK